MSFRNMVSQIKHDEVPYESRLGSDSHADISCAGKQAHILEYIEGLKCTVHPFHDSYTPKKDVKLCNVAFAHDLPSGETIILRMNQCLDFTSSMEHSLFCTNQVRANGIIVDDVPKCIDVTQKSEEAIIFPEHGHVIPFSFKGPVPYIPVRKPRMNELEDCTIVELTSAEPWIPDLFLDQSINAQQSEFMATSNNLPNDLLQRITENINVSSINVINSKGIDPFRLSTMWNINIENAKRTIRSTEQHHVSIPDGQLTRRRRGGHGRREHRILNGHLARFCSDTFSSNITSLRGNKYIQLFTNRGNFAKCYPMCNKYEAPEALHRFIDEVGIPSEILTDGAPELNYAGWKRLCQRHRIKQLRTEPESPWQNPAELAGGIIKRRVRRTLKQTAAPIKLWDYCWEHITHLRNLTASDHRLLDDETPYQKVYGSTPNITEFVQFKWFEWIWFYDTKNPLKESLGRYLGSAQNCGEGFTSYILTKNGKVIVRSSLRPITDEESTSNIVVESMKTFTKEMESLIGNDSNTILTDDPYASLFDEDNLDDEEIELQESLDSKNSSNIPITNNDPPLIENFDEHIGVRMKLPVAGEMKKGVVTKRKRSHDGSLIGTSHWDPQLDTREYEVQFDDKSTSFFTANTILENLWQQCDEDGGFTKVFKGISSHRKHKSAIDKENGWYSTENNVKKRRITTKGWDFLIDWSDGTQSWLPLYNIKQSNPIEAAEYAVSKGLSEEPAFAWWVKYVLKKRSHFVSKLKTVVRDKQLKFGLKVPKSVKEALAIDAENNNDYWDKAIKKELGNVIIAFKLLEDDEPIPIGSTKIPYHFVFDVKFDLTRKARLVAGGHRHPNVPSYECYSSVASRETVRLAFLLATMNRLKILVADIGNAYLNAPCREKVHVTVGPELFGDEHAGKTAVIVRALYGLRSAGASWRSHLSNAITNDLKYKACKADGDIYMKPKKRADGSKYYSYLVVYVDDILSVDENPQVAIDMLGDLFRIKEGSVTEPKTYLGSTIRKWTGISLDGSQYSTYAMGSSGYVKEAIRVVEERMSENGLKYIKQKAKTPFTSATYRPELDSSQEMDSSHITLYQNFIGILRWICELGRLDILLETNLMSQYMVSPRVGHLNQLLNIFSYLKHHDRSWLVFNPEKFDIEWIPIRDEASPKERAALMKRIYPDANQEDPPGMPEPRGSSIQFTIFVDADHAGNKITRRSQTGILVYANMTPIQWISKRQNTVESSTFGSEFLALKHACELIKGLIYKIKMLGIPIEGPVRILCDNQSVVINGSFPESVLKKKHCSIAYHIVRETVAAGIAEIYWEDGKTNLADLFTKVLPEVVRNSHIRGMLS